ncbi:MAG: phosphoglycerate kinase, partial [Paracoccaceae bacterium]
MTITSISSIDVSGRTLVVRADLNAPMKDGRVSDATRIERFAAGLKPLLAAGAKAVILSHFGRPKGQVVPEMSLAPIAPVLGEALGQQIAFVPDCIGSE